MHDAQIRVAIAGAGGRMGRQLIQAALQMDGVALGAALERLEVRAFGCLLEELMAHGDLPASLREELSALMHDCLRAVPTARPDFASVHARLVRMVSSAWVQ